jgi:hypothetical protein
MLGSFLLELSNKGTAHRAEVLVDAMNTDTYT